MSGTSSPLIQLDSVTHGFNGRDVLSDVNLTLSERRIGVIGANGSGKSTLARLLNGLIVPSTGVVTVDGFDTARQGKNVRGLVGFVFQNPENQIVYPVVEEDIAFGLKNMKLTRMQIEAKVSDVLAKYDMEHLRKRPSHLLSGGEKQLLAIAGVMAMEPRVIVFDEPTTLLDLRNRNRVASAIAAIEQTVITVSHDLDLLLDYDRVLVIDRGRIVADDAPRPAIETYKRRMGA